MSVDDLTKNTFTLAKDTISVDTEDSCDFEMIISNYWKLGLRNFHSLDKWRRGAHKLHRFWSNYHHLLCVSFVYGAAPGFPVCGKPGLMFSNFRVQRGEILKNQACPRGSWAVRWDEACLLGQWVAGCTHLSPAGGFPAVFQEWPRRRLMTPKQDFSLRENLILWPFSLCVHFS